jgi:hypothetical protein
MVDKKENGVPLSKIVSLLKIDPKNARARLRRVDIPKGMTIGDSWMFTPKGVDWVKNFLKRDGRKAS